MGLRLAGEVALDGSGWESGLKKLEGATDHFASHLKGMAAAAFGALAIEEAIRRTVEWADQLADTSARLGISTDALQEFSFAAQMTGASLETLTTFIEKLNSARVDPKKWGAFQKLGISSDDLRNLPAEEITKKIGLNIRDRNPQQVSADLKEIGGKGAGQLIPMLKELEELSANAPKVSPEDIAALKQMKDLFSELWTRLKVLLVPILSRVGIVIMAVADGIKAAVMSIEATFQRLKSAFRKDNLVDAAKFALTGGTFGGKGTGEIGSALKDAFNYFGADFDRNLDELQQKTFDRLFKRAEGLGRPEGEGGGFDLPEGEKEKEKSRKLQDHADSLSRIGNFLGQSQSPMERVFNEHTVLLRRIATNTEHLRSQPHSGGSLGEFGHL